MRAIRKLTLASSAAAVAAALLSSTAGGQQLALPPTEAANFLGVPGYVDMPSARSQPEGELSFSVHGFDNGTVRTSIAVQLSRRLQALFRYASIPDIEARGPGNPLVRTYDRSFDVRFQILSESARRPELLLGLQDIGGTGLYGGEYLVASKAFGNVEATAGIGWGRYGTDGSFSNPLSVFSDRFDTRPVPNDNQTGTGGKFGTDQLFRGPAALFGGVAWQQSERLRLAAEYSSDAYVNETRVGIVERDIPLNFGADYRVSPNFRVTAALRHGTELGVGFLYTLNPRRAPGGAGGEGAPEPVLVRPPRASDPSLYGTEWTARPDSEPVIAESLGRTFAVAGLELQSYRLSGRRAQVRFINPIYESQAQAVGRAARAMTRSLPASVEQFEIVPLNRFGVPGAAVVLRRSDVEALENRPDGAAEVLAVAGIVDAERLPEDGLRAVPDLYPRFTYALGPYGAASTFDPEAPVRLDLGVQLQARYEPRPGVVVSGAVRRVVVGNRDENTKVSDSKLPKVRTDSNFFAAERGPYISYLTGEYFFRPAPEFYGRVSAGLLEAQYGGLSAELLWKPATGPLAIGAEVNEVRQRDFDQDFGFQDLEATTGGVTGYLEHGGGFHSELYLGQYLAGDRGATYRLARRFPSGWEVSAYATKTDVSAEDFGEGSFDKGIEVKIPLTFFTGQPSRETESIAIQPLLRDGGARLRIRNRLYDTVSDQTAPQLTEDWGRFWR
ncbi:YjbH domain-containing protein [Jannaschia sp. W003]|uniref:YjbH domain-containing protein n=1 Tax=Jannaschia sp. W003 TaxID=2867012 RepID=UPI0021A6361A|nr:YjbH domain-containing protein [Jannaschia sp. W003]UWQ22154.1 YjbH domain-containing protein [Jannaschia sp. W003]